MLTNAVVGFFVLFFKSVYSDDLPRKKSPQIYKPPTPEMLAYLDFSVSTTGILAGVKVCTAKSCSFFSTNCHYWTLGESFKMPCVIFSITDVPCGHWCLVSLHQAAVWALPFTPDSHLPGPVLRPGLRALVPVQVSHGHTSYRSFTHCCLIIRYIIRQMWLSKLKSTQAILIKHHVIYLQRGCPLAKYFF